ncbi:amino acid adenylation domain-containing protein [Vreelandella neptunia]|uniref:amino acid adenylation domain-containing protein n=1 Tax=Vreelandella neptunia TaxID=115551 RepID=UPI00315A1FF9
MSNIDTHRIAERFAGLHAEQRRVVYEKIRSQGFGIGQFPILSRPVSQQTTCSPSYAQLRQWFLWRLDPQSSAYHITGALSLKGGLDSDALWGSFAALISRHEALRTVFRDDGAGEVMQVVQAESSFACHEVDLVNMPKAEREVAIENQVALLCNDPFDLEQGPLLRVGILRLAEEEHLLVVVMHHIISDGWSMQLIIDEFAADYSARVTGETWQPPVLPIQYADYALWQRQWMEAGEKERQLDYWQRELGDEHPVLQLPTDRPRRNDGYYHAARHHMVLPESLINGLRKRTQSQGATLFMTLLTGFQALLYRYTGQEDIRVGVPIANRHRTEAQGVVGLFVNTQVLRNTLYGRLSLTEALEQGKRAALGAQEHQDLPFEQLVEALQPERSLSHTPLFQVMFNYQQQDHGSLQSLPGLELSTWPLEQGRAQLELTLNVVERMDGCLEASFVYAEELFDATTIERLAQHYTVILQALAEMPERALSDIELLDKAERLKLQEWGVNTQRHPAAQPIHHLIERQAEATPEASALVFDDQSLSYAELNTRANQLAHYLIGLGVKPETRVGIAMERSIEMVVGLLAILKAGGAYVPLDPEYPTERLAFIAEDSGIELLLTQHHLRESLPVADSLSVVELDRLDVAHHASTNPAVALHGEHLAYVIYTSGSTGRPKGAAIRHDALTNCMVWMQETYQLTDTDAVLHKAPFGFDVSVWEIFWPLSVGSRLVIAQPGDHRDPERIIGLIQRHGVTTLNFVPSMLKAFLTYPDVKAKTRLKHIMCGGEAVPATLQQDVAECLDGANLHDLYGPTETTIHVTHWWCRDDAHRQIPIGRPISGTRTYVLDGELNLVPQGVAGELYLGGVSLARGYLNRSDLTAERFVADPFTEGERLYRTGDLVRWREDGQLEYLGRLDHQVKIRGLRIELGEIEAELLSQPEVRETVVVAHEGPGGSRLVAYVVPQANGELDTALLRERLGQKLPDYMVPGIVVTLEELPLNANGKVDRKALPEPEPVSSPKYEPPQGEMEETLAQIWSGMLGIERVGRHDNFFELGGHSLLVVRLTSRVRREQNIELPVRSVFDTPILKDLATCLGKLETLQGENRLSNLGLNQAPQSFAQQRLWFLNQLEPNSSAYHLPGMLRLKGALDEQALQQAFDDLARRHAVLRTRLVAPPEDMAVPRQVIDAPAPVNIERADLSESGDIEKALRLHAQEFMGRPFLLAEECLWRVGLVKTGEQEWRLLICMHHAISDGWSVSVLLRDFSALYGAACRGEESPLGALLIQYADFAIWQREWLAGGEGDRQLNYWCHQLGDEHPVLELPTDRPRPARQSFLGARHRFTLNGPLAEQVHALAAAHNATPFMVLLATYQVLLYRLSGQSDLRVGVPIAGRNRHETEDLIGFFVNTQVLRCEMDTTSTFGRVLESVREAAIDAQAHQDLPFEQLVEALQPERSLSHNPLFQVLFDHQRHDDDYQVHLPGLVAEVLELENGTTQFDLALNTQEDGDGVLTGSWNYATDLFDSETIEYFHVQFECLLEQVVVAPERIVCDYDLLDEDQRQQLSAWNHTGVDYGKPQPVHRLFERQAMLHPGREALVCGGQRLSYAELDRAANRLAHYLLAQGIGRQALVGLAAERSIEMVVALYAIHKAGAAYVPIDPDHPETRQQQVLTDAGVALLLTHDAVLDRLPVSHGLMTINLDRIDLSDRPTTAPDVPLSAEQRAYVIYTSGSTGKPKGVANTHGALYNRLQWMQSAYSLKEYDSILQKTPYSFDVSVWEFFWPLMVGARLVVAQPGVHQEPKKLMELIRQESVTTLHFVPSMLAVFLAQEDLSGCDSLRRIVCSGEALPKDVQDRTLEDLPQAELYNLYGPTEAAIDVTHWICGQDERTTVPIGRPIGNLQIHILDSRLAPQPIGVAGELYIGGAGLAEGYHGRPELTAERFIPSPFEKGKRLYRSGDLARWCRDGTLEYLGRLDYQIKLRGLRIELGEIEVVMRSRPDVGEAVVVAHQGQLVGYAQGSDVDLDALQAELRHYLPDYMVPAHIVTLETFPLSANGKLDRKALPIPAMEGADYKAPQTQTECRLVELWQEVLEVERVGRRDNFFSLGGHSLLGVHLVHRIQKVLKKTLPLNVLFESATLATLAAMLERVPVEETPALQPAVRGQLAPQSFAQQRLWFLAQLEPDSCAYHLPSGMRLQGDLDEEALIAAFEKMIVRHESLRTCFCHGEDGTPQQRVLETIDVPIERHDLRFAGDTEAVVEARFRDVSRRPFDLEALPPWRGALVQVGEREWCLLICMHHIISDGWSMQVLLEELVAFYRSESLGEPVQAEPLATQYADYAIWQREQLSGAELERQLAWWKAQLGDEHPPLDLPADRSRPAQRYGSGAQHTFNFPPELVDQLRQSARDQQASLFMLILTGFAALLHRLSGQRDLRIGVPVAGRHQPGTEGIIGFFVNTLVLRAETEPGDRISDLLAHVCKRTREVHAHADLPFEQLVEALQPERSLSHNPLFQVGYNHQVFDHRPLDRMGSVCCEPLAAPVENAHFDLVLGTQEDENGHITGHLNYATDIFNSETVVRMADQLLVLLKALAECPQRLLCDIDLLSDRERGQLQQWGVNEECHSQDEPIHCLIERQAAAKPKATALIFDDRQISYAELNARANQLAHYLIGLGVKPETRVGIAVERSINMVVGLLAILKAGGAYVPLDPEYPSERLAFIAEDSGIELLLTQHHLRESLPVADGLSVVELDRLDVAHHASTNPAVALHGEHLAYVIYTSGSTGRPKGAAIRHDALTNCMVWMQETYQLTDTDAVLHKAPFGFDVSVWEIFWPLSVGSRLVIAQPGDHRDPERIIGLIQRHGVTTLNFVPSMLKAFLTYPDVKAKTRLKHIMCGGEAVPATLQQDVAECLDGANLHDLYGPTETTIHVTHWWCRDDAHRQIPIGRPISGTRTYVLDGELNLVPQGVAGELYLGGVSLARGYLNRSDLTAERFVADPFTEGERLYRTGDLVRWREDGQLEYLGRLDHQVKIRGLRIELGEIEAELLSQPEVRETVVVAHEGPGGSRLVAYVVPQANSELDTALLRERLGQKLPDYMVPGVVVMLEELPLNANGKVDRKALPEPEPVSSPRYAPPQGEVEVALAELWQMVLGHDDISRNDSFFELGGDSIQSLGLITRLRRVGWHLAPKDVFLKPRLVEMATALEPLDVIPARVEPVGGDLPLTPIQAHFFDQPMSNRSHWNQALLLRVKRSLDPRCLFQAVQALIDHHDGLRLGFYQQDEQWMAFYRETESAERILRVVELESVEQVPAVCDEVHGSFELSHGPLAGLLLMNLPGGEQRLLLSIHHLIVDGVSWRILLEDLDRIYRQIEAGLDPEPGLPCASYQQWANHLSDRAAKGAWDQELDDWLEIVSGDDSWPVDDPQGRNAAIDVGECEWRLSADPTRRLLRETLAIHKAGIDDVLLTALAEGLRDWGGLEQPLVAVEGHGREPLDDTLDLSRTLGWFTCLYPLRLRATGSPADTLELIRQRRAAVPGKGIGFGALRYLGKPEVRARLSRAPTPRLAFNYLGQLDESLADSRFQLAPESPGKLVDPWSPLNWELEINGQIHRGELSLTCRYSGKRYHAHTVQRLMEAIGRSLEALIAATPAPSHQRKVPVSLQRETEQDKGRLNPLLRLAEGNDRGPAIFCPHPVSGTVVGYYPLAAKLVPEWAIWGLQNRQVQEPSWRDTSLVDMARDYVRAVLEQQPKGPYYLLGWSMGGTLALEMAALLERLGKTVAFVGLIDGYVPGAGQDEAHAESGNIPDGQQQDDWQQLLAVEQHLRHLALGHDRLRLLHAPVHAWWASQSPESNENAEVLLAQAIGHSLSSSVWLDTDHMGIVRHPVFLEQLARQAGYLLGDARASEGKENKILE